MCCFEAFYVRSKIVDCMMVDRFGVVIIFFEILCKVGMVERWKWFWCWSVQSFWSGSLHGAKEVEWKCVARKSLNRISGGVFSEGLFMKKWHEVPRGASWCLVGWKFLSRRDGRTFAIWLKLYQTLPWVLGRNFERESGIKFLFFLVKWCDTKIVYVLRGLVYHYIVASNIMVYFGDSANECFLLFCTFRPAIVVLRWVGIGGK